MTLAGFAGLAGAYAQAEVRAGVMAASRKHSI
jgi:hypothetical protein